MTDSDVRLHYIPSTDLHGLKDPSSEDVGTAAGEAQASPEDPMTHAQGLGGAPQAPDGARMGLAEDPV